MKKVKIFLASSEELKQERLELADFVEHLNHTLEKLDINVQLVKWEYLDSSMGVQHKQEDYNDALKECEICIVIYWTRFGMYTRTELDTAYTRLKEGSNPKKLYVYFKDVEGEEEITEELKKFRDSFPDIYGHFNSEYRNIDTLKTHFLLQFLEYQSENLKGSSIIELRDGRIFLEDKIYVDLKNVPFMGNNDEYNRLLNQIEELNEDLMEMSNTSPRYEKKKKSRDELLCIKENMEQSLWRTALNITRLSNQRCSDRLRRAIDLFNRGNNKGADALLEENQIFREADNNLRMIELGEAGKEGLKINIEELILKTDTLQNEGKAEWRKKLNEICCKLVEYTKVAYGENSIQHIVALHRYGKSLITFGKYEEILKHFEKALHFLDKLEETDFRLKIKIYNDISGILIRQRRIKAAINLGKKAVNLSVVMLGELDEDTATTYETLANCQSVNFFDKILIKEGLENARKALLIREKIFGPNHLQTAKAYEIIGNILVKLYRKEEAKEYLFKAFEIRNAKTENKLERANSYHSYAWGLRNLDPDSALAYNQKGTDLLIEIFGGHHERIVYSYIDKAFIYRDKKDFKNAIAFSRKALEINNKLNDNELLTASIHRYLANFYGDIRNRDNKDLEEALKHNKIVLKFHQKLLGKVEDRTLDDYYRIANNFYKMKDYKAALQTFLECHEIIKENFSPDDIRIADSYENIADSYKWLGEEEKELEFNLKAYEIKSKKNHINRILTNYLYKKIVNNYRNLNNYKKSLEWSLEYMNFLKKWGSNEQEIGSIVYENISEDFWHLNEFDKAISAILEAVRILNLNNKNKDRNFVRILKALWYLYFKSGQVEKSFEIYNEYLDNIRRNYKDWNKYEKVFIMRFGMESRKDIESYLSSGANNNIIKILEKIIDIFKFLMEEDIKENGESKKVRNEGRIAYFEEKLKILKK